MYFIVFRHEKLFTISQLSEQHGEYTGMCNRHMYHKPPCLLLTIYQQPYIKATTSPAAAITAATAPVSLGP
jgi:hypothetical protein